MFWQLWALLVRLLIFIESFLSGGGKSTLLDVLANRIDLDQKKLKGDILLNGKKITSQFKRLAAYVMQEDTLHGSLSVRENLYFSVLLRLENTIPLSEKEMLVNRNYYFFFIELRSPVQSTAWD